MPCEICGKENTIKAHLIPKTLATEVNEGQAHAAAAVSGEEFRHSQSGLWDRDILCAECDQEIGKWENHASNVLQRIREKAADEPYGKYSVEADGDKLLRFCAALLWKYSVTKREFGRIKLGPYQRILRGIAFEGSDISSRFNAFLFRLKLSREDDDVFAYRAPTPDKVEDRKTGRSVNLQRFLVGGCLFFARLDQRSLHNPEITDCWLRGKNRITFISLPAQQFEEYRELTKYATGDSNLSDFLEQRENK